MRQLDLTPFIAVTLGAACGSSPNIPRIEPPVKAAAPAGLIPTNARLAPPDPGLAGTLSASGFKDRFFSGNGPTDVFGILQHLDARLADVNSDTSSCVDGPTTDYTITPWGQTVAMKASCAVTSGVYNLPAFMQFAVTPTKTYVYILDVAGALAAIETTDATGTQVDVWYAVGVNNATSCGTSGHFDGCSYGVTQIHADPATKAFEMTTAGIGEGYCGVQVNSDGTSIYGEGSPDLGMTCDAVDSLCVSADLTTTGTCTSLMTFTLPAIGRKAGMGRGVFGASLYPATPNITLDGTATDSLGFGPLTPTAGVATF